jgi:mono/diheme cytochrome c family protein
MPRIMLPQIVWRVLNVLVFASFIPLAYIVLLRQTPSVHPRVSIVPDMDKQQKFTTQSSNSLFADGRAMRLYPAGTVARDDQSENEHLYRGIVNGQWALSFPMRVNEAMMERGQRQYNIYCSPCHGYSGYGDGMIAKRADQLANAGTPGMSWVPPKSLQDPDTIARPVGHVFNTITHGIRTMPSYGDQLSVEDRWAVILYVRALQRSQNANLEDVPPAERNSLLEKAPSQGAPGGTSDSAAATPAGEQGVAGTPPSGGAQQPADTVAGSEVSK